MSTMTPYRQRRNESNLAFREKYQHLIGQPVYLVYGGRNGGIANVAADELLGISATGSVTAFARHDKVYNGHCGFRIVPRDEPSCSRISSFKGG